MSYIARLLLWSVGMAFIAWALKHLFDEEKDNSPETIVSRIRQSGF